MSTDEYAPSDEEMLSAYVTGRMMRDGLMRTEAEQEFRCGLARVRQAEREARRKAEARIQAVEDVLAAWHVEPGESGLADDLLRALNT